MLTDENLKALIEAIIYVAPDPVPLDALVKTLEGEERERVKAKLEELIEEYQQPQRGIQIRPVAGGYKFSSKAEHHEVLRKFVKSLKPLLRLSRPSLETLAVIAYRQPVTLPEIEAIRGVDCGGVIHTLMERKLVVTAGRKSVVGRPILYRTSRDFLVHFGLKDVNELPSLKEFEEMARRALGSEWTMEMEAATSGGSAPPATAAPQEGVPVPEPSGEAVPQEAASVQEGHSSTSPSEESVAEDAAPSHEGASTPELSGERTPDDTKTA